MWKGRFQTETSNLVQRYGESISYDWRLYAYDIEGSIAQAAALQDADLILAGLEHEAAALEVHEAVVEAELDALRELARELTISVRSRSELAEQAREATISVRSPYDFARSSTRGYALHARSVSASL